MERIWEQENVDLLITRINLVNSQLKIPNIKAMSYLLRKNIDLSGVFTLAKEKYECETNKDSIFFVVMVMKLSCCSKQRVKELVKDIPVDPFLLKADGFQLLNKSRDDDDLDFDEALISKLKMRGVLISLDSQLESDHHKKFRSYICAILELSEDRFDTNFLLYEHLENRGKIEPGKLEIIRRALSMDGELQYALKHFDSVTKSIYPSFCHSKSVEETEKPSPYATKEIVSGATPSSVSSTDTSSSATEGSSSFRFAQQQMIYSPMVNESATLAFPTDPTSTQTELSNTENSTFGDI